MSTEERPRFPRESSASCEHSRSGEPPQHTLTRNDHVGLPSDALPDRVRLLERMVTHMLESAKYSSLYSDCSPDSPPSSFQRFKRAATTDEDEHENMFTPREKGHNDLSLSSQVAAMFAHLSRPASPRRESDRTASKFHTLVEFPDPPTLQRRLDIYFHDFDCYFPFLDRQYTEPLIFKVIRRLGYSSYNRNLLVTNEDLSTIALACVMLALAEALDEDGTSSSTDSRPGWAMYLNGRRALQRLFYSNIIDLDVVRAQCLTALYLYHCQFLNPASQAISVGFQLAVSIKLHDQKAWPVQDYGETATRQQLWWTLYFVDRRIAQRGGLTYHIRDIDFDVQDLSVINDQHDIVAEAPRRPNCTSLAPDYMQALISLGRLWSKIWDTFFAIGAPKKGDWMEVEIMDTQILNAKRQLPQDLTWVPCEIIASRLSGEAEISLRRKIQINTRLNLLRMLIRQNPVRRSAFDLETAHLCARLARETILSHVVLMEQGLGLRAIGYFTTASLVECVYHLVPVLHYSNDREQHTASVTALNQAHTILIRLSTKLYVAEQALKAICGVVERWKDNNQDKAADTQISDLEVGFGIETDGFAFGDWMDSAMGGFLGNDGEVQT